MNSISIAFDVYYPGLEHFYAFAYSNAFASIFVVMWTVYVSISTRIRSPISFPVMAMVALNPYGVLAILFLSLFGMQISKQPGFLIKCIYFIAPIAMFAIYWTRSL